ncbi:MULTISPECIES: phage major capsid protein [Rhizobium]|uniref:Peptidase U35 phage prohead HK97 n=1 Tax=Rhizobium favelukesii TaxID=348824 RepID=W6R4L9_9HYPH|nr:MULTISPECIES: phage major capsid protein [Rhizobium]MCS0462987.1 phage major capsid protein [Rhizobium favelukesii]UFS82051.1 phage major capsid protein [Rhizobium sp. T136]CDM56277.1 peptidase U35 phage prohead HK97 [Rhizobium favelukesii]
MNRMYSVLTVKAVEEDQRIIRGVATTPNPDRVGDIVEPLGVQFKNPMPLLHQHVHDKPVGTVTFDKPTKDGITFEAKLPKIEDAGPLRDRIETAWGELKAGLVRAVSIGFRSLEHAWMDDGGIRFIKSEVLELSLVSVPANADAVISTIKSIDRPLLAATGKEPKANDRPARPGASGKSTKPVNLKPKENAAMKTVAEQIAALEASRQAKSARMGEVMHKSIDEGRSTDQSEQEEFDTLEQEVGQIDGDLKRLRALEKTQALTAKPVIANQIKTTEAGAAVRMGAPVVIKSDKDEAFEGQSFTRMVIAKTLARIDDMSAVGVAHKRWGKSNPQLVETIKAAVAGGGTESGEWGSELVHIDRYTGDFIEYLYSRTVFDKLPLREVPANVNIAGQDGAATGYWVGQSKSIPVTKADFFDVNLTPLKVAALAVVSKELLRDSSPSAEKLVRDALVEASAQRVDQTFLGTGAAVAGVSPAGILNGVTAGTSAGSDIEGVIADVKALYAGFIAANNADGLQFVTTQSLAKSVGLMQNALGNWAFPGLSANGGSLLGDPLVAGGNVGAGDLILLKPSDIYKIGDRGVEVSLSTEAAIEMDSAPAGASDTPTANTSVVSMFQTDSVAIKVVRPLNFAKRRASAVAYIGDADYGAVAP